MVSSEGAASVASSTTSVGVSVDTSVVVSAVGAIAVVGCGASSFLSIKYFIPIKPPPPMTIIKKKQTSISAILGPCLVCVVCGAEGLATDFFAGCIFLAPAGGVIPATFAPQLPQKAEPFSMGLPQFSQNIRSLHS